jgi:hypothetical protein
MLLTIVLAAAPKVPKDGEGVKSGPIGLAVILVLCVAAYFLFKSMSKHLKKVREEFPSDEPTTENTPAVTGDSAQSAVEVPASDAPPKPDSP